MSENNVDNIRIKGVVSKENVSPGSKQEHLAYLIKGEKGQFILRRIGANAFDDNFFETYLNKPVVIKGLRKGNTLLVKTIKLSDL